MLIHLPGSKCIFLRINLIHPNPRSDYLLPPAKLPASKPMIKPSIKPSFTFFNKSPIPTPSTTKNHILTFLLFTLFSLIAYLFFGNAIKLAINLYAPGTPAGNSRKNTSPVYTKFPLPYLPITRLPLVSGSVPSCMLKGIS